MWCWLRIAAWVAITTYYKALNGIKGKTELQSIQIKDIARVLANMGSANFTFEKAEDW